MAPRAITYCLAQFVGEFPGLREAVQNHVAQSRGLGNEINLQAVFERLEGLCRRELQQLSEDDPRRSYWKTQYGYVRSIIHHMKSGGIAQNEVASRFQVGRLG